ncbi:MAG: ChuX/HutX family heme-like substrate-binding protein [Gammaproteobacteria bacterium]|nr:ChuX/HutX family heme-like substrate-binding protein [Gammaproteobacteria bacterium]
MLRSSATENLEDNTSHPQDPAVLRRRWHELRAGRPRLRIREGAATLGTTEAELVAAGCGDTAVRLKGPLPRILEGLGDLGEVMALTRSDHAVHERHGCYRDVRNGGAVALLLPSDGLELRVFYRRWHHGFAVTEDTAAGTRRSFQFFDSDGTTVHKVYLTDKSDAGVYESLVAHHRHPDQSGELYVHPYPATPLRLADEAVDVAELRRRWNATSHAYELDILLCGSGVDRLQALRLVGHPQAEAVSPASLRVVLQGCAEQGLPLRIQVASPGVVQTHCGPVARLVETGPWFNVLDPEFSLHLRDSAVASAWVVRLSTIHGDIASLELFDAAGGRVAVLTGERLPGCAQSAAWLDLLAALPAPGAGRAPR